MTAPLSFSQLQSLWINSGGAPIWAPTMAAIAMLESSGDPTAHNPSGATGLWQIEVPGSSSGLTTQQLYDPTTNAKQAIKLLGDGSGIQNWGHGVGWNSGDAIGNYVQDHGNQPLNQQQLQAAGFGQYLGNGAPAPAGITGGYEGNPPATGSGWCNTKGTTPGQAWNFGGIAGFGSITITWCEVKSWTGAFLIVVGGGIMLTGVVLIFGGILAEFAIGRALSRGALAPVLRTAKAVAPAVPE